MNTKGRRIAVRIVLIVLFLIAMPAVWFLIWRIRLADEVNRHLAEIRAAGLPTSGAELNSYFTSIANSENAALVMTQAFALICDLPDNRSNEVAQFKIPMRLHQIAAEEVAMLEEYVALNSNAVTLVDSALHLEKSRYPANYSLGIDSPLPHLALVRKIGQVEEFAGVLSLRHGRHAKATGCANRILGIARTLNDEPTLLGQLVRMTLVERGVKTFERRACAASFEKPELDIIANVLAAEELTNSIARAFVGERALLLPYFQLDRRQLKRFALTQETGATDVDNYPVTQIVPFVYIATGLYKRDMLFFLQTMEASIVVANKPPPGCLREKIWSEQSFATAFEHRYFLSAILLPSNRKAITRAVESLASVRLANTSIGIERFFTANGRFPKGFTELVPDYLHAIPTDPFDGLTLRYKLLERGYQIYSVGRDVTDDGGREKPCDAKVANATNYDLTFTVER